ncbi:cupin domain-containing protein [Alkalibacter saccharofermentans]|uniref:Cupin domain-containing protein n=1 Tax=Alkalibacter saccharofermentans DSM 14828 TaxID=1120975 RepID=A0A1M4ZCN3_9FIRM|nr:cupin domain-containing protein [Alkalibacter saccharofermentans]SHF15547.1 Cupin domain-containing protein [Alkalibacter saccharofermentans DSM 14828]
MDSIIIQKTTDTIGKHKKEHEGFEYYKSVLVPARASGQCKVTLYEIPPKQAAYPYHYHTKNEESFYILKGKGLLRTPKGEEIVGPGDFIFFPASKDGAHKLTNVSDSEFLVYLDFDTYNDIDVAFYPDSNKIGIWGKGIDQVYKVQEQIEYYDGE